MAGIIKQLRHTAVLALAAVAFPAVGAALLAYGAPATRPSGAPVQLPAQAVTPLTTQARPEITKLPVPTTQPRTLADLQRIQARVEAVVKEALPATVSIQIENDHEMAQGSGIIVTKSGYILTAGHVSGTPGTPMKIVLSDGRRLNARALGANNGIDSGMVKIIEPGDYPFVPVGSAKNLVDGQWVVALGHPGGYVPGRPPVVRLGRVLLATDRLIDTDTPLISGDSGGPLFDLDGRLIGINSRIGSMTTENIHVPIDTFVETWDRLAKGDKWVDNGVFIDLFLRQAGQASMGLTGITDGNGVRVTKLRAGPAKRSGLLVGDLITRFNGDRVPTAEDLAIAVAKRQPGDAVTLTIVRAGRERDILVTLDAFNGAGGRMFRRMRGR